MVSTRTRMAFGLVLIVALLAAHTATAARTIDAGSKEEAVMMPVVDAAADLTNTGARALMGKGDGGKKGPPPIVCKKTPGPKGVNIVCN